MWLNRRVLSSLMIALMIPILVAVMAGVKPERKDFKVERYDEKMAQAKLPAEKAALAKEAADKEVEFNFLVHKYLKTLLFFSLVIGLTALYRGSKVSSESLGTAYTAGGLLSILMGILGSAGQLNNGTLGALTLVTFGLTWHLCKKNCLQETFSDSLDTAVKSGRGIKK